ncbi:MAG: hypothetical protein HKN16_09410 [Saprospiraceae bacterium]|nr:hypothetical protein [Saprospiraceae bacterium]
MKANPSLATVSAPSLWAGQLFHFASLAILLFGVSVAWDFIGRPNPIYFWLAISVPVLHQLYVWITWRLELQDSRVSKALGFKGYFTFFFILLIARPISMMSIGWVNRGTLGLTLDSRIILSVVLLVPALYLAYCINRYFTITRAAGADHFKEEYRNMPLVKKGIFKYSPNAMYVFGFFALWAIAIKFNSEAALIIAAFNHLYIWVHYYATEKPDMKYLYG